MQLLIQIRNVYGNEMIYPVNETARVFARIAGTKTLTRDTLKYAKDLGYAIDVLKPEFAL